MKNRNRYVVLANDIWLAYILCILTRPFWLLSEFLNAFTEVKESSFLLQAKGLGVFSKVGNFSFVFFLDPFQVFTMNPWGYFYRILHFVIDFEKNFTLECYCFILVIGLCVLEIQIFYHLKRVPIKCLRRPHYRFYLLFLTFFYYLHYQYVYLLEKFE